jgi:hypothetical protein
MLAAVAVFGIGPAAAQDFTAGKTPAQLFQSDCSACHKSPAGLAKGRDTRALTSFLREHYTTKKESAAALAGYLGGAGRGPAEGHAKPTPAAGAAPNPAAKPQPLQRREGDANPTPTANTPHEAWRAARPPAGGHEPAKSEAEEAIRKLNGYAAAGGSAHDTERSADTANKLQSYAGAGSRADTLTPADQAKPKKRSATSASAPPSPSPATAPHPPAPHRPPSTVMPRPASNN